jgi:glycosyltransferase involved in cell wall biosynthesis
VFAALLGHRRLDAYDAKVLHHRPVPNYAVAAQFQHDAFADVEPIDFGWRRLPPLPAGVAQRIAGRLRYRKALSSALRTATRYGPDVVYSNQQKWDCGAATTLAVRLSLPHIVHLHYRVGPWLGEQPLRRLLTCDQVVAVSDFVRDGALRYGVEPHRVTTILNPMELPPLPDPRTRTAVRHEFGVPQEAPLIGITARMDPDKGHRDLVSAFARIAPCHDDARLLIVGNGSLRRDIEMQAGRLGLAGRILFTGYRTDVRRLLAALDIFAHPSKDEPCSLAMLEASAIGLPIVAYNDGGTPEIVENGGTGILAERDDVEGLASGLGRLLDDSGLRQRLGANGRDRIRSHHSPEVAANQLAAIVRRVSVRR